MDNTNFICDRLKAARKECGLTMQKLVDHINADPSRPKAEKDLQFDTYKSWEYGKNAIPLRWIPTLCKHLSCDAGYLLGVYDDFEWKIADIRGATGFSAKAANTIRNLDVVLGNDHFAVLEDGTLSKRSILSEIIADKRIMQILINVLLAKQAKLNLQQKHDCAITAPEYLDALTTLREMNMVILKSDDAINFYIQEASRIFTEIIHEMVDSVSDDKSYSTKTIDFDAENKVANK